MGPEGEALLCIGSSGGASVRGELGQLVSRLINRDALDPEEIAIIVPDEHWVAHVAPEGAIAGFPTQDASQQRPGCLTLDTIRRFKGLESCVVIIVTDDRFLRTEEVCYVALSRGRTRVYLLGKESFDKEVAGHTPQSVAL